MKKDIVEKFLTINFEIYAKHDIAYAINYVRIAKHFLENEDLSDTQVSEAESRLFYAMKWIKQKPGDYYPVVCNMLSETEFYKKYRMLLQE